MIILKQTGVTRRIDDLGRIVIPKEIRKNLKIRNNDELLISINDDNIVLSKYMKFNRNEVLDILVKTVANYIKKDVLITSKDQVIVSSNIKYNSKNLSNSVINKIENREIIKELNSCKNNIFNDIDEFAYIISPFIVSSDVLGSVIIISSDTFDDLSIEILELIKKFLENYLEE